VRATRVQWALLAAGAALALLLVATFRRVPRPPREAAPAPDSPAAPSGAGQPTTLLSGFDYSETTAGKTRFSVHADRTVGFAAGAGFPSTWYGLERVVLTIHSPRGEPLTVRSDAADYDPRTRAMHLKGNVVGTDPQGTVVRAGLVRFDPAREALEIPGTVDFSRGAMSGRAASGTYLTGRRTLTLVGPVTASGGPEAPFDSLAAAGAEYRVDDGRLAFSGPVRGAHGADTLLCDALLVHLTPESRIESAVATGNASGGFASGASRGTWTAAEARSRFDPEGRPSAVDLEGRPAAVVLAPSAGESERRLTAPQIALAFRDGRIAAADARGGVRLERVVPGPGGSPVPEWIAGDTGRASFSADGSFEAARLDGHVTGSGAEGSVRSPAGSYAAADGVASFFGAHGEDAELLSPRGRVLGSRIDLDEKRGVVVATGDARAILLPGPSNASAPSFVTSAKAPTRARADRIVLDDRARTAQLSGRAALWQGDDSLAADRIDLHDADRTAFAEGDVRVSGRSAAGKDAKASPRTAVSARTMRWTDATRTAAFEGGVVARRGTQTARGDRGECRMDASGRVERTVLEDAVTLEDPSTGRRGSGTRAVDDPAAGVTNLAGEPAVAQDAQGNRIQGSVLTFRKESGSVEVKAKDGGRVESVYQTHGN